MEDVTSRHRAIMRLLVAGGKNTYVADIFKMQVEQLDEIVNSPLFKEEMEKLQKEIDKKLIESRAKELLVESPDKILKEATELAAQTLKGALQDPNVHGRIKASIEVLNRAREADIAKGETVEPTQGFKDMMDRCMQEVQQNGDKSGSEKVLETENTG